MSDLVTWLRAQLDEDEQAARAAADQYSGAEHWTSGHTTSERDGTEWYVEIGDRTVFARTSVDHDEQFWPAELAHIARHDPARVLRDVEGKRRIIDEIGRYEAKIDGEWGCCHSGESILAGYCPEIKPNEIEALRLLALPYAGRPGYLEEWRP